MIPQPFWKTKRVLVTGHTGFKGGWLCAWLLSKGANVIGYALKPDTKPNFFDLCQLGSKMESIIGDIRDQEKISRLFRKYKPEIVFHLAAQSLVRRSYEKPLDTFHINVLGTVHLLEAVRQCLSVRSVVNVTSDKCYENKEWIWGYRENEPLGGKDPYSASKACAELAISAYRKSFFDGGNGSHAAIASVRAGNVIGGGDWAKDRLVPDAVRSLSRNQTFIVRNPQSLRPWQHVTEPLSGYLMLAQKLYEQKIKWEGAWNFGPREEDTISVSSLADKIVHSWGSGKWQSKPNARAPHEAHCLRLDLSKTRHLLRWHPSLTIEEAVGWTLDWYRKALAKNVGHSAMHKMTLDQIQNYEMKKKGQKVE